MHLQLTLPEKPDAEDEAEMKNWRWKTRSVKKINSERHSLRCDLELKLAVRPFSVILNFEDHTILQQHRRIKLLGQFYGSIGLYSVMLGTFSSQ